jgi:hypothetical protein
MLVRWGKEADGEFAGIGGEADCVGDVPVVAGDVVDWISEAHIQGEM